MAVFAGTSANEFILPDFVSESVVSNPAGALPSVQNDIINGGGGDDQINASGGNDIVVGGTGNDGVLLGQGDDIFRARRGDGNDTVNGGPGYDSYEWTGSDETGDGDFDYAGLELLASGIGLLDHPNGRLNDVERVRFDLGDGDSDEVILDNLAGSSLQKIEIVDSESVVLRGDYAGERLTVRQLGAITTVTGLQAVVTVEHVQLRRLALNAGDGDDVVNLSALGASAGWVEVDGGDGDDLILAGMRTERLRGDAGNDRISYANSSEGVKIGLGGVAGLGGSAEGDRLDTLESLTGSAFEDVLGGNGLDNVISGGAGDDRIEALAGDDRLNGGAGDDYLGGNSGADVMFGGAGDDEYRVDNVGDRMFEGAGGGEDVVFSQISLTLPANVEHLVFLPGAGALSGRGNGAANIIRGNEDANVLQGRGGGDELSGGDGNDTLDGGLGIDVTNGGLGDDRIYGGAGADLSRGAQGRDRFYFDAPLGSGVDTIDDFMAPDDTIMLRRTLFGDIPAGTLAADAFVEGTVAQDAEDRVIYHASTGRIFFDADGAGGAAAILLLRIDPGAELTNVDFRGY